MNPLTGNSLSIRFDGKGIPYGGIGEPRADGGANFGFKNLAGHPELVDTIPELATDPALRSLVAAINNPKSGLFSVGCASGDVKEREGFRRSGYIEFAVNSRQFIAGAQNYFPLFFHFSKQLFEQKFAQPAQYHWELQPAAFFEAKAEGFTCTIFINTHFFPAGDAASQCWELVLKRLEVFLGALGTPSPDAIYEVRT